MLQEADKIINLSTGDKEKAVEIYKKFAAQGNMYAIAGLGVCYCYAKGVKCDIKKGIELIKKAIKAGNPKGYNVMGVCYKWGVGVERNLEKSVEYFLISAKLGFAAGQYNLGDAFLTGKGISKDYKNYGRIRFERTVYFRKPSRRRYQGLCLCTKKTCRAGDLLKKRPL